MQAIVLQRGKCEKRIWDRLNRVRIARQNSMVCHGNVIAPRHVRPDSRNDILPRNYSAL